MGGEATPQKAIKKGKGKSPKKSPKKKLTKKDLKDPEAPKRAKSAFMFFGDMVRDGILKELKDAAAAGGPKFQVTQVGAKIAEKWRAIAPEQKAEAERKAREDKERADKEKKAYADSGKEAAHKKKVKELKASGDFARTKRKRKVPKHVLKKLGEKYERPGKAMSAYFQFMLANQQKLQDEGFKALADRGTEAAKRFKALAPADRKVWDDKVAADKAKFAAEMKAWKDSGKEKEYNDAVAAATGSEKERQNKIKERKKKSSERKSRIAQNKREKSARKKARAAKKKISKDKKGSKKKKKKESSSEEEDSSEEEESDSDEESGSDSDSDESGSSDDGSSSESESESEESSEPKKKKKKGKN